MSVIQACDSIQTRLPPDSGIAGYNMEMPAHIITWGQIAKELSHVLVDHGIAPDEVTDETLIDLIEEVKVSLYNEGNLRWREMIRVRLTTLDNVFPESQEPDEGVTQAWHEAFVLLLPRRWPLSSRSGFELQEPSDRHRVIRIWLRAPSEFH